MEPQKQSYEKIDIYKGKEKVVLDGLEKKGYSEKDLKKRLEEIKKLEEADKQKLEKVEAGSKEHIELINKILKEKEKEQKNLIKQAKQKAEQVKKDVENNVSKKVEEVKDKAVDTILEKTGIGAIMEKFTGMFDKFSGFFDTIGKKITALFAGTALGTWLGLKKEEENNDEENSKESNKDKVDDNKLENKSDEKINLDLDNKETKKPIVSLETKIEVQYISGIKTLLSLTGIKTETNVDKKGILDNIKNLKYNKLIDLEESEKKQFLGGDKKETFDKILEQFKSDKFKTLATYNFKQKFLEKIINDDNGEINEKLVNKIDGGKKRLRKILTESAYSQDNPEWWREVLTIEEIALLYTSSFNILSIPTIKGFDFKTKLGGYLFDKNNTINEVENNFVSKNIISGFASLGADFGSKDYLSKDEEVKKIVGKDLNEEEKEQLDKIIDFKNYILNKYLEEFKPKLSDNQKELFKDNLDYKWIITLYSLLKGKHFDNDINLINKLSLIFLNSKIICGLEGSNYIGKIIYDGYSDGSVFNKEEKKVLGIYKDKFVDIMIFQNLNEIGKKLGLASGLTNTDLETLAIGLGGGGTLSYIIGNNMIKNKIKKGGISMLGVLAKKVGIVGIFGGIAIGGYTFYNKPPKNSILEDLKKEENNPKELLKILENYKNSIKNYPIDGKNISVIKYNKDTPLILMDKKVYTFSIIEGPIIEKIKKIDSLNKTVDVGKDILKDVASGFAEIFFDKSGKTNINGEIINFGDIKINNEIITFGKNNSFTLSELFESISSKKIDINKSLLLQAKELAENNLPEFDYSKIRGSKINFIKLKELGEGKFISLVQIGEINP